MPQKINNCIVLSGPESAGKTTLCTQLAAHFETSFVTEYARSYLENKVPSKLKTPSKIETSAGGKAQSGTSTEVGIEELEAIASGQLKAQTTALAAANKAIFFDTDLHVIRIWALDKFGHCPDWITQAWLDHPPLHYLLCSADLPWEEDPLRADPAPQKRAQLFEGYQAELETFGFAYTVVDGVGQPRLNAAIEAVSTFFLC